MKLVPDLEARFITFNVGPPEEHWPNGRPAIAYVETIQEAHGVWFLCPKCFAENRGNIGTHMVGCYFVGKVPDWAEPGPGRWNPSGTGLHDLTFVPPGQTSVHLTSGCGWHGNVTNGDAS